MAITLRVMRSNDDAIVKNALMTGFPEDGRRPVGKCYPGGRAARQQLSGQKRAAIVLIPPAPRRARVRDEVTFPANRRKEKWDDCDRMAAGFRQNFN
jgi:hypothetical protein